MPDDGEIITVDAANVDQYGFFCYKSKPKSVGYRRKLDWLRQRFTEGLKIHIVYERGRPAGFVESIPGEATWRAVRADGYLVIHCIWVVGRDKGKGYGSRLVNLCAEDARERGMAGVAMVAGQGTWLAKRKLFERNGFELTDHAPPAFDLLVKRFGGAAPPAFPRDWDERARRYGPGLTVVRTDQCPYIDDEVQAALRVAAQRGLATRVVELTSGREAQDRAPSAYGVFSVLLDGQLIAPHYWGRSEVELLDRCLTCADGGER